MPVRVPHTMQLAIKEELCCHAEVRAFLKQISSDSVGTWKRARTDVSRYRTRLQWNKTLFHIAFSVV